MAFLTRSRERIGLAAILLVAVAVRVPGLGLPLIEWHGWRQTQTAFTALWLRDHPFDLFHAQLPIFGPPFEAPMELPLFQWLGALVMHLGVEPDTAMRVTGLATFILTAVLLWVLLRRYAGSAAAFVALAAFLFVPINLLFGKGSLPEYLATAGALGWLLAGLRWREAGRGRWYAIAFIAGTVGMLAKPTTPLFWTVPLVLAPAGTGGAGVASWLRQRLDPRLIALVLAPVAIAYAWTTYADGVKSGQIAAAFLASTSDFSRHFYYSDLKERTDPAIWARIDDWVRDLVIGAGLLPFAVLGVWAAVRSERRLLWIGATLAALLAIALFFGGYFKHDYYWTAVTPEAAILVGLGASWLWHRSRGWPLRTGVALTLVLASLVTLQHGEEEWRRAYPPLDDFEGVLARAHELATLTRSDDLVVVLGRGFDPDLLYYARRRGAMITIENAGPPLYRSLAAGPYRAFFSWDPAHDAIDIVRWWPWDGLVGPHTYAIGASPGDLRGARVTATDDGGAYDLRSRDARPLTTEALRVPCDLVSHAVPAGRAGTWLRLRPDPFARVWLTPLLAPQAVRTVVTVDPAIYAGQEQIALYCDGAPEIVVDGLLDAPPP
ncbi:MAG TPA: glycosyltransferase family 39 protein [Candidatus Limnocylindria bacterium]|nr:glycosyltransferase family 39 protein [Candidatus Limnocylindria bacterium]